MPVSDVHPLLMSADQQVLALHDVLSRIAAQNNDPRLLGLIADAAARCQVLRRTFEERGQTSAPLESPVDRQVFERLMSLAGYLTAVELLDQLLLDLKAVAEKLKETLDWGAMRAQCHILVAVCGAIGAQPLQTDAEHLQDAAIRKDAVTAADMTPRVKERLVALIAFVAAERSARSVG